MEARGVGVSEVVGEGRIGIGGVEGDSSGGFGRIGGAKLGGGIGTEGENGQGIRAGSNT